MNLPAGFKPNKLRIIAFTLFCTCGVIFLTAVTINVGQPLLIGYTIAILLLVPITLSIFSRPRLILFIFIFLLPVYQILMMFIYQATGSTTLLRVAQLSKDFLGVGGLIIVTGHLLYTKRRVRLTTIDYAVVAFGLINLLYLVLPADNPILARVLGTRANTFLIVFYLLGRLIIINSKTQSKIIFALATLGILTGLFVFVDRFILPVDWPASLGLRSYLAFQNNGNFHSSAPLNLTWTFWTSNLIRRSSSFFANPLDLAASTHITGVTGLILMFSYPLKSKGRILGILVFGLMSIAVLFSISRASLVIFAAEILLVALLFRRYSFFYIFLAGGIFGLVGLLSYSPDFRFFFIDTVTLQNNSIVGHIEGWLNGLIAVWGQPFGFGPGMSSHVGNRFGNAIGGESQYISILVELGIWGLLSYILIYVAFFVTVWRVKDVFTGATRQIILIAGVARLGLGIAGISSHIELYLFQSAVSWWLVGLVSQIVSQHTFQAKERIDNF